MAGHLSRFGRLASGRFALLLAGEAVSIALLRVPDARLHLSTFLLIFAAGGLLSLLAARILSVSRPGFVLLCAIVFRLTLVLRPADLSDDLTRYLWDARIASAGVSPWAYPPNDPAVARIAPDLRALVAHPELRTVYPPVAESLFALGSLGGASAVGLKMLFAAADVGVVWLLGRSGTVAAAALYAFHPLALYEIAGQGHVDAVGTALLLATLAFLAARRPVLAGAAFAASVLTKYVPLAAAGPVVRRGGPRLVAACVLSGGGIWAAAAAGGPLAGPAGGLFEYARRWESNSILYPAVERTVRVLQLPEKSKAWFLGWKARHGHPAWTQSIFPYFYSAFFARLALSLLLALVLVAITRRVEIPDQAVFASLAALLLFSPTLHPWYLLWVLPFAARFREPAFLYLSFACPLAYGLLYPVPGLSRGTILAAEYAPFLVLLGRTLLRKA